MSLQFNSPWYFLLLLLLPLFWYVSRDSLSSMGRVRRVFAVLFRSIVYILLVARAGGNTVRTHQ